MSDIQNQFGVSGEPSELEQRLRMSKRAFVRLFLGTTAAYSVPLMASFSMEGLGIGKAHGKAGFPPGLFQGSNQGLQNKQSNFPGEKFPFLGSNQAPDVPATPPGLGFPD